MQIYIQLYSISKWSNKLIIQLCLLLISIIIIKMDALGLTQQLSSYIIRPPRAQYKISDLGQKIFQYKGIVYQRIDFVVAQGKHNQKLQASIYVDRFFKNDPRPTVVYLHANSSSRVSVKNYLINLIAHFDVITFDFRGCGLSEGNFLTLGYLQKYDVRAVIQHVEKNFGNRKYYIWGRSMGAVTAIMYTAKYAVNSDKLIAMVLDSPFADLQKIIHFLANKKVPLLPTFMLNSAIQNLQSHIKQAIQKQYNKLFLIRKYKPIQEIPKIRCPIFFIGSKSDQLVSADHVKLLYQNAYCRKQMEMLQGGHNEMRPDHLKLAVVEFLLATLSMKKEPTVRKKIFSFGSNLIKQIFSKDSSNDAEKNEGNYDRMDQPYNKRSSINYENSSQIKANRDIISFNKMQQDYEQNKKKNQINEQSRINQNVRSNTKNSNSYENNKKEGNINHHKQHKQSSINNNGINSKINGNNNIDTNVQKGYHFDAINRTNNLVRNNEKNSKGNVGNEAITSNLNSINPNGNNINIYNYSQVRLKSKSNPKRLFKQKSVPKISEIIPTKNLYSQASKTVLQQQCQAKIQGGQPIVQDYRQQEGIKMPQKTTRRNNRIFTSQSNQYGHNYNTHYNQ